MQCLVRLVLVLAELESFEEISEFLAGSGDPFNAINGEPGKLQTQS
jgi:hypothetical protein